MTTRRALLTGAGLTGAVLAAAARPARAQPDLAGLQGFDPLLTGRGRPGRWEVVADASVEGGQAVAQLDADPVDTRFPMLAWRGLVAADVEASVRFKAVSGRGDRAGGLAVRVADANTYVVVRANALEDNVRLYRVVRGDRQQFAGADVRVAPGEWHMLGLRAEGDRFTVAFDGRELFTVRDPAIAGPGRVALWTKADSVTWFTGLAARSLR